MEKDGVGDMSVFVTSCFYVVRCLANETLGSARGLGGTAGRSAEN